MCPFADLAASPHFKKNEQQTRELPSDNKVGLSCEKEGERTMKKERGRGGKRQSVRLTEASRMEQR